MEFTPGKFQKLKVASQFHFGPAQIDLPAGAEIEFDGVTMKFAGKEYTGGLGLVGAYKAGWLIERAATAAKYVAKPAGVQVRPATSAGQERGEPMPVESAAEDDVVVGSIDSVKVKRDASLTKGSVAAAPKAAPAEASKARPAPRLGAATPPKKDTGPKAFNKAIQTEEEPTRSVKGAASVTPSSSEIVDVDYNLDAANVVKNQNAGARPVAKLSSPKMKTVLTDSRQVDTALRELDNVSGKPVRATKIAAASKPTITPKPSRPKANDDAVGGTPITQTLKNGATGDVEEARSGGDDLSELLPDAATSGKPLATKFAWDMKTAHWRERVKLAVEKYANKPAALEHIYSIETDAVIKNIKSALARR